MKSIPVHKKKKTLQPHESKFNEEQKYADKGTIYEDDSLAQYPIFAEEEGIPVEEGPPEITANNNEEHFENI